MTVPRFTICIPNFNYARYIGLTINSVLSQKRSDVEIAISDNASTDGSVAVIEGFADARIKLRVNNCNVGFSGNLDKTASMARGQYLVMLSSDDVMADGALDIYDKVLKALPEAEQETTVLDAGMDWIDSKGGTIGYQSRDPRIWADAVLDQELSERSGATVYSIDAVVLLRRSLLLLRAPLPFGSTCYPRTLYEAVEGYGGGRLYNPDKWFAWKLLTKAQRVLFVDLPLFKYRWHGANQASLQSEGGTLKHLVDQYVNAMELDDRFLSRARLTHGDIVRAFVSEDIALRGLKLLATNKVTLARRYLHFGLATYPKAAASLKLIWLFRILLWLGPIGTLIAKAAYGVATRSGFIPGSLLTDGPDGKWSRHPADAINKREGAL